MLFSSGDSPQSASSNLSGEGFDEVQPGESPFVVFASSNARSSGPLKQRRLHSQTVASTRLCSHAAQRQHIVISLAIKVDGATTPPERYARTQCLAASPADLPAMHAEHKQRPADHVAKLASNAEKMRGCSRSAQCRRSVASAHVAARGNAGFAIIPLALKRVEHSEARDRGQRAHFLHSDLRSLPLPRRASGL
jgi:hypothetical protein